MKPRKREFKRDNKLKFAYIKDHWEWGNDFIGIVPESEKQRSDLYLLFYTFISLKVHEGRSLVDELKHRGYDIETIYFEIEKKKEEK